MRPLAGPLYCLTDLAFVQFRGEIIFQLFKKEGADDARFPNGTQPSLTLRASLMMPDLWFGPSPDTGNCDG